MCKELQKCNSFFEKHIDTVSVNVKMLLYDIVSKRKEFGDGSKKRRNC